AGVAGETFLRGLIEGKILAGYCPSCKKYSLPPRIYCVSCYGEIKKFSKVGPTGKVSAVTTSSRGKPDEQTYVYVTFTGVQGGIVHRLLGKARAGTAVVPRFRPKSERTGSILDIQGFESKR
ncbi:MAG: zinc ribbon domain-containing protein, partial [Nitrososphaerales archaeon]